VIVVVVAAAAVVVEFDVYLNGRYFN